MTLPFRHRQMMGRQQHQCSISMSTPICRTELGHRRYPFRRWQVAHHRQHLSWLQPCDRLKQWLQLSFSMRQLWPARLMPQARAPPGKMAPAHLVSAGSCSISVHEVGHHQVSKPLQAASGSLGSYHWPCGDWSTPLLSAMLTAHDRALLTTMPLAHAASSNPRAVQAARLCGRPQPATERPTRLAGRMQLQWRPQACTSQLSIALLTRSAPAAPVHCCITWSSDAASSCEQRAGCVCICYRSALLLGRRTGAAACYSDAICVRRIQVISMQAGAAGSQQTPLLPNRLVFSTPGRGVGPSQPGNEAAAGMSISTSWPHKSLLDVAMPMYTTYHSPVCGEWQYHTTYPREGS